MMSQKMHEILIEEISNSWKDLPSSNYGIVANDNDSTNQLLTDLKIQRFEDLNRLTFFKSFMEHKK